MLGPAPYTHGSPARGWNASRFPHRGSGDCGVADAARLVLDKLSNHRSLSLGDQATMVYGEGSWHQPRVADIAAGWYTVAGGGSSLKTCTCTHERLTPAGTRLVGPAVAALSHEEHFAGRAMTAEARMDRATQLQA